MRLGVVGIVAERLLEALDGVRDLPLLQQGVAGIRGHRGPLAIHNHALQFRPFLALGGCLRRMTLLRKHGGQCQVRIGLVRHLTNRFPQSVSGLRQFVHLAIEAAQRGPAVGIVGVQLHGQRELASGIVVAAVLHIKNAKRVMRFMRRRV